MKKILWLISLVLFISAAGVVSHLKLPALIYYSLFFEFNASNTNSLGLSNYSVTREEIGIKGINKNLSGLTYSNHSGTLFSVINRPPKVVEISTEGELIREIPIAGDTDPEGITHVKQDLFIISEERSQQIFSVRINSETQIINKNLQPKLGFSIDFAKNKGHEGVSWDGINSRLWITKEKSPLRVLTIHGLLDAFEGKTPFNLQIKEWKSPTTKTLFMTDISSVSYVEKTETLLLLSDESKLIVEYREDGKPLGVLPLRAGYRGLSKKISQAEGVAVGPNKEIYIISEPNLLYRFDSNLAPKNRR